MALKYYHSETTTINCGYIHYIRIIQANDMCGVLASMRRSRSESLRQMCAAAAIGFEDREHIRQTKQCADSRAQVHQL
jgi:hypothetical protein